MTPLPFAWPYALIYWVTFMVIYSAESRIVKRAKVAVRNPDSPDAGSLQVIMFGGMLGSLIAVWIAWMPSLRFPASMEAPVFIVGLVVTAAGGLLRRHCFRMLGTSFTGDVRVPEQPKVITSGAYSYLRHPSYTGGILMQIGFGLSLGSWASTLALLLAAIAVYAYRIKVEERVLLAGLGEPYQEFMNTRKRLIPFVY